MVNKMRHLLIAALCIMSVACPSFPQQKKACDIDRAIEICSSLPLDPLEGVWSYPEDNVTVLILKKPTLSTSSLSSYDISVVESDDCRLLPGETIGSADESPEAGKYVISLFTESNKGLLCEARSCTAVLSKDNDALIIKGNKQKNLKFRLNINLSRILPNFWRIVRVSASSGNNSNSTDKPPVGMVKIFPSYDGNGSSRRQPRYL